VRRRKALGNKAEASLVSLAVVLATVGAAVGGAATHVGGGGVSVEVSAYGEPIAIHELRQGFEVRGIRGRGGVALGVLGIAVDSVREGRIEVSTPGVST